MTLANKLTHLEKMHSKGKGPPGEVSGPILKKKQKTSGGVPAQPKCERCLKWGGKPNGHTAAGCRRWFADGSKNPAFGKEKSTQPSQNGNDRRRERDRKRRNRGGEVPSRRDLKRRILALEKAKDDE